MKTLLQNSSLPNAERPPLRITYSLALIEKAPLGEAPQFTLLPSASLNGQGELSQKPIFSRSLGQLAKKGPPQLSLPIW